MGLEILVLQGKHELLETELLELDLEQELHHFNNSSCSKMSRVELEKSLSIYRPSEGHLFIDIYQLRNNRII